jgi:outer membrane protein with beta-barrel domain
MKYSVRTLALTAFVLSAVPVAAQKPIARVTPYVGFLASGSIAKLPLGFSVGSAGAPVLGLQLGVNVTPNIAVVGNVGYANTQLEAGVPFIGGLSIADNEIVMYDGGVQLRFPAVTAKGTGIVPFVEGSVGAIRNEIKTGPVRTTSTNVAFVAGGGLDLQVTNGFGLRLMAKDHMSKFDYGEALGINVNGSRSHNWVLGAGVNIGW